MITNKFEAKLIDFGLAIKQNNGLMLSTICGSPSYESPQMLLNKYYLGSKTDIWSLGVLLFTMIEGIYPFEKDKIFDYFQKGSYEALTLMYLEKIKNSSK